METYVIVIFIILVILTFVLSKNNRRFIIYSITGLKRYFDNKININYHQQDKHIQNLNTNLNILRDQSITKDFLESYTLKDDLGIYALKDDLGIYALKDDLGIYALKDDLEPYVVKDDLKNELQTYVKKEDLEMYVSKKDFLNAALNKSPRNEISKPFIKEGGLEIEKYRILSKIIDAITRDTGISTGISTDNKGISVDNKDISVDNKGISTVNKGISTDLVDIRQGIKTNDQIDEIIKDKLNENSLTSDKLYDSYQPNWM
jgi:hypothetical protein